MVRPILNRIKGLISKTQSISKFEDVLFLDEEQKRALNQSVSNYNILSKVVMQQVANDTNNTNISTASDIVNRIEQSGLGRVGTELGSGERIKVDDATNFMEALDELKIALKDLGGEVELPLSELVEEFRKQAFVYANSGEETKDSIKGLYSVINVQMGMARQVIKDLESRYSELSVDQLKVLDNHREYLKGMEKNTEKIEPLLNIDSDTLQSSEEMREKLQSIFKEISDDTVNVKMYHQLKNIDGEIGNLSVSQETLNNTMVGMKNSGKEEIASKIDIAEMAKKPLRGIFDYALESTGFGFLNELGITDAIGGGIKNVAGLGGGVMKQMYQNWNTRKSIKEGMREANAGRTTVSGGDVEQPQSTISKNKKWKVGARKEVVATERPAGWGARSVNKNLSKVSKGKSSTSARRMVSGSLRALGSNMGGVGSLQVGTLYVQNMVGDSGISSLTSGGNTNKSKKGNASSKRGTAAARRVRDARGRFVSEPELIQESIPSPRGTAAARSLANRKWTVQGRNEVPGGAWLNGKVSHGNNRAGHPSQGIYGEDGTGIQPNKSRGGFFGKTGGMLGKTGGMLGKTGGMLGKLGKFAGPLGIALSAGFALKDAAGGWGSAGDTFGLSEGRKANTGQKMASAAGGALSGLSFGLLPSDMIAKGLYGMGGLGGKALKGGGAALKGLGGAAMGLGGMALKGLGGAAMGLGGAALDIGKLMTKKIKSFGAFLLKLTPGYWIAKGISSLFSKDSKDESLMGSMTKKIKSFGAFLLKLTPGYWIAKLMGQFFNKKSQIKDDSDNKNIIDRIKNYMTDKIKALTDFVSNLNPITWGKKALEMLGKGGGAVLGAAGGAISAASGFVGNTLGSLSAKHESGNLGTEAVGWDQTGGASYGKYQLSTKKGTVSRFMTYLLQNNPEIYKQLSESGNPAEKGGKFEKTWKNLATDESSALPDLEHKFVREQFFSPAFNKLDKESLRGKVSEDKTMQDVLWSTAVQHGPKGASDMFNKIYKEEMSNKELIKALYDERKKQFGDSTPEIRNSVIKRLSSEMLEAISKIGDTAEEGWDATKGFMKDTYSKIDSFIKDMGGDLASLASQGIKDFTGLMGRLTENGINTVEDVLQYLKDTGGEGLSEIQKLVKSGVSSLGDLIPKLANMGGKGLKGLLGLVANLAKNAGEFILDSLGQIGKVFFHEDINMSGKGVAEEDLPIAEPYNMGPKITQEQFEKSVLEGNKVTPIEKNDPIEQLQDMVYYREGHSKSNKFNRASTSIIDKIKGVTNKTKDVVVDKIKDIGGNKTVKNITDKVKSIVNKELIDVNIFNEKIGQDNKDSITGEIQSGEGTLKQENNETVHGVVRSVPNKASEDVSVKVQNPIPEDSAAAANKYREEMKQERNEQQSQPMVIQSPSQQPMVMFDKRNQIDDLGLLLLNTDLLG